MSISTVSQQFHVDIVDIDMVSKPGSMQNIVVDIDGFTAVSRRYRRYRQGFKAWFHAKHCCRYRRFHSSFTSISSISTGFQRWVQVKHGCRYRRFHSSFTSISSISTEVQSLVPCYMLLSISTVSQQFHVDIDDIDRGSKPSSM